MRTLAQQYTDPPLLEHWLFENPWPGVIALIVLAALLRLVATRTGRKQLNFVALGCLVAAGGVYASTVLVTTVREDVAGATDRLLDATVQGDGQAIAAVIHPNAVLLSKEGRPLLAIGELRQEVGDFTDRFPITWHTIKDLAIQPHGEHEAVTRLDVRTGFEDPQMVPTPTTWQITWRRDGQGGAWQITEMRWLAWRGQNPPGIVWR